MPHLIKSLFLFLPFALTASINEPMRWEWQTGYRNDNLHWHLQNPGDESELTYSEHYRNLQFWENALSLRVIYRDIALFVRGSGAFGKGRLKQRYSDLSFTSEEPQLFFDTNVWEVEGWGSFGYAVNLTPDRTYRVGLIPFVGYGVNYEYLDRNGIHTAEGEATSPSDTYTLKSRFPSPEKMTWFGPLIGGLLMIQPGGLFQLEVGYAYHRMHLRFKTKYETTESLFSGQNLTGSITKLQFFHIKDGANLAQSGWGRIDFYLGSKWRLGLFGQIQYFASRVLDTSLQNLIAGTETPQKYKVRWTAVSGALSLSRSF